MPGPFVVSVVGDLIAAAPAPDGVLAVKTIPEVIEGLRWWIMGIAAAIATLFLVVGGLRLMAAGGDPTQAEQGKANIRSALIGYAVAVLAPVILQALQSILGG
jgi:hypothetical protein